MESNTRTDAARPGAQATHTATAAHHEAPTHHAAAAHAPLTSAERSRLEMLRANPDIAADDSELKALASRDKPMPLTDAERGRMVQLRNHMARPPEEEAEYQALMARDVPPPEPEGPILKLWQLMAKDHHDEPFHFRDAIHNFVVAAETAAEARYRRRLGSRSHRRRSPRSSRSQRRRQVGPDPDRRGGRLRHSLRSGGDRPIPQDRPVPRQVRHPGERHGLRPATSSGPG